MMFAVQNPEASVTFTILVVRFAAFLFDDLTPIAIIESVSSEQLITTQASHQGKRISAFFHAGSFGFS